MSSAIFGGGGGWLPSTSRPKATLLMFTVKTESKQNEAFFRSAASYLPIGDSFISCVQQVYGIFVLTRHSVLSCPVQPQKSALCVVCGVYLTKLPYLVCPKVHQIKMNHLETVMNDVLLGCSQPIVPWRPSEPPVSASSRG